eukprot:TRINITY_DN27871_c0_g1_i1.p1 TRINITY_DN27871_c0_g1~~TRINITY_DN27871_c0_g1_i1.p1  ORF type:complete len:183 (+),score=29.74 TRINITY_DN27871_c0_g1_i1:56-550(+)
MVKGAKLTPHDKDLISQGVLKDVTHPGGSSIWLEGPSSSDEPGMARVYRPMGDKEAEYLIANGILPDTQPYQAIIEGDNGRVYAEKYLNGKKWVDTSPTTVVEFKIPEETVAALMAIQCKAEDGAMSMGLGSKAGKGLPLFNKALAERGSWKIVKVKRSPPKER